MCVCVWRDSIECVWVWIIHQLHSIQPTIPKTISASIAIKPTQFVVFVPLFLSLSLLSFASFNHCHRSHFHHTRTQRSCFFFRHSDSSLFVYFPIQNVYLYKRNFLSKRQQKTQTHSHTYENNILNGSGSIVHSSVCDCRIYTFFLSSIHSFRRTNWMSEWMVVFKSRACACVCFKNGYVII